MGDIRKTALRRILDRALTDDAFWKWPAILLAIAVLAILLYGCASFDYDWRHTRPASEKPWLYIYALDADIACRGIGAQAAQGRRINGCAQWREQGCLIVLPENAPAWLVRHEERHCEGWTH